MQPQKICNFSLLEILMAMMTSPPQMVHTTLIHQAMTSKLWHHWLQATLGPAELYFNLWCRGLQMAQTVARQAQWQGWISQYPKSNNTALAICSLLHLHEKQIKDWLKELEVEDLGTQLQIPSSMSGLSRTSWSYTWLVLPQLKPTFFKELPF